MLREAEAGAELLLIERATREGDPWSGHMAFPGGRLEAADASTRSAARRETLEEVGVELAAAEYLGRLGDLAGNRRVRPRLVVSAHAFAIDAPSPFALDPNEVQSALWFPLVSLQEPERRVEHEIPELPGMRFPGILVGEAGRHIVWGLTYRFLDGLFEVLGDPFPNRWGDLERFQDD